jgi:hypothetical protein
MYHIGPLLAGLSRCLSSNAPLPIGLENFTTDLKRATAHAAAETALAVAAADDTKPHCQFWRRNQNRNRNSRSQFENQVCISVDKKNELLQTSANETMPINRLLHVTNA